MAEKYKNDKLNPPRGYNSVPRAADDTTEKWNKQLQERLMDLSLPERTRIWLQSQLNFNLNNGKTRMGEEDQEDWNTGV